MPSRCTLPTTSAKADPMPDPSVPIVVSSARDVPVVPDERVAYSYDPPSGSTYSVQATERER